MRRMVLSQSYRVVLWIEYVSYEYIHISTKAAVGIWGGVRGILCGERTGDI